MPLNKDPGEELKKITICENNTSNLRERMDLTWSMCRLDEENYSIPKKEGEWDKYITNWATTEGNRMTDLLSYARRMLWIPIGKGDKRDRDAISMTEMLANGALYSADEINADDPLYSGLQNLFAFYAVYRGWTARRLVLRMEDDKLIVDLAVWDPRNTYWLAGRRRLSWVAYQRFTTEQEAKDDFGDNIKREENEIYSKTGLISVSDIWECSDGKPAEEGVIIGGEWVKGPEKVKVGETLLDYIPVRIKAGRSAPLIADKNTDNIKMVGEDFLANNRLVLPILSRLMSYKMTASGKEAKTPRVLYWDSTKSENAPPAAPEKDPYVKGRTFLVDRGKGEELGGELLPGNAGAIDSTVGMVMGEASKGGLASVGYGVGNRERTAEGTDIVFQATMDAIKPFKLLTEDSLKSTAEEIVRQYKLGDFGKVELEGYDKGNNRFHAEIKSKEIDPNWHFECQLIPDILRDKQMNVAIAAQMVKSGLTSAETARDEMQIVTDTDLESEKIAKEKADALFDIGAFKSLVELIEDYAKSKDPKTRILLTHAWQRFMQLQTSPQQPQGETEQPMPTKRRRLTSRTAQSAIPPEVMQAAQMQEAANAGQ